MENIAELKFELEETESNPQLVQIVPPNEVVVVISFELTMGGRAGTMSLCIPYNVIEPVVEKLSNQSWLNYRKRRLSGDSTMLVGRRLAKAALGLRAFLAYTKHYRERAGGPGPRRHPDDRAPGQCGDHRAGGRHQQVCRAAGAAQGQEGA